METELFNIVLVSTAFREFVHDHTTRPSHFRTIFSVVVDVKIHTRLLVLVVVLDALLLY